MNKISAYNALVRQSEIKGWPRYYREDLTVHDKAALENLAGESFAWILREYGTVMIELPQSLEQAEFNATMINHFWIGYGKALHHYYIYDKDTFWATGPEEILEKFGTFQTLKVAV